ncbi:MAG: hypothetical protein WC251_03340 [Candidatus Izemoplasmatales bacterium]
MNRPFWTLTVGSRTRGDGFSNQSLEGEAAMLLEGFDEGSEMRFSLGRPTMGLFEGGLMEMSLGNLHFPLESFQLLLSQKEGVAEGEIFFFDGIHFVFLMGLLSRCSYRIEVWICQPVFMYA